MSIDPLLKALQANGRASVEELAEQTGQPIAEVAQRLESLQTDGTILGYQAIVDPAKTGELRVAAVIEVKITPKSDGGFDAVARRIARFDQVSSCYLSSGGHDLMLVVHGKDLLSIAQFVSEKLSTMAGVLSTSTHFRLKTYKENGFFVTVGDDEERLPVTP